MKSRKPIPEDVVQEILIRCRRRCCFCFGLDADFDQKQGQIAHLDHDSSNHRPDNLAFMCLKHHDAYDSRTSQSRGFRIGEAKTYREELVDYIQSKSLNHFRSDGIYPQRDYLEALRFHTGTHRSRSLVLAVEHENCTLEEINAQIPPYDLAWTRTILAGVINFGWVRNAPTDFHHYELTMNGRHMLNVLASIDEETKHAAWKEVWDIETVRRKYGNNN